MRRSIASINDLPIAAKDSKFHWPLGRRPDDHAGVSEPGLCDVGASREMLHERAE
jgi:nuclear transport factor 2 (NTF2) superfamily protein